MTANEDLMDGKPRYFAPEHGVVTDNADPLGLYRVKLRVPGIIEETEWALPFGTQGGGSKGRGAWVVPDVGADVVVQFLGGDVERPIYQCGWWGIPDAGTEMPTEAAAVDPADAHKVQTIHESSKLKVWVDERPGKEQLGIQNKDDENTFIQIDLANGTITLQATAALILKSYGLVKIEGIQVYISDRIVTPDSKPI